MRVHARGKNEQEMAARGGGTTKGVRTLTPPLASTVALLVPPPQPAWAEDRQKAVIRKISRAAIRGKGAKRFSLEFPLLH